MIGNDWTGDLTALAQFLDTIEASSGGSGKSNWVKGTHGPFKICAKIFADKSSYGIKNGRISKLQINDVNQERWGFEGCFVNYDRGWDITPANMEVLGFLNELLVALGDDLLNFIELNQIVEQLRKDGNTSNDPVVSDGTFYDPN